MRMLRWMCRVTKLDRIRNERIREAPKVGEIAKKFKRGGGTGTGTYDEKRRALHRKKDDGERIATMRDCTTELHGVA